jgi:hypothetical protein
VECKPRCDIIRSVSDPRRLFQPAFGVTESSNDQMSSTMSVIIISLGTFRSARENIGCIWEHLGAPATGLGASQFTVEQSRKNIFFGNTADSTGNHSNY